MKKIGLRDKHKREIRVGDVVRFYYDCILGYSDVPDESYTEIIDVVCEHHGEYMFLCDIGGMSYAWRHNKECEIIGNVYEDDIIHNYWNEGALKLLTTLDKP